MANPQYPWNFSGVSNNPNITWDIIRQNLDYPWKLDVIMDRINPTFLKCLPEQLNDKIINVIKTCEKYTHDLLAPQNKYLPISLIKKYPTIFTSQSISMSPNLTWRMVSDHPSWAWDWVHIICNYFKYQKNNE